MLLILEEKHNKETIIDQFYSNSFTENKDIRIIDYYTSCHYLKTDCLIKIKSFDEAQLSAF
jgi:hypothetical protein